MLVSNSSLYHSLSGKVKGKKVQAPLNSRVPGEIEMLDKLHASGITNCVLIKLCNRYCRPESLIGYIHIAYCNQTENQSLKLFKK